jgi:hypothetical protein
MEQDQNVLLKLSLIPARVSFNSDQLISNIYSKLKVSLSLNSFILLGHEKHTFCQPQNQNRSYEYDFITQLSILAQILILIILQNSS